MALVCPIHKASLDSVYFTAFMGWICMPEGVLGRNCIVALPAWGQGHDPTLKAPLGIAQMKPFCSGPAATKELLLQSHMLHQGLLEKHSVRIQGAEPLMWGG